MSKLQSAMNSYHLYEGTQKGRELDEAWLKTKQEEHEKGYEQEEHEEEKEEEQQQQDEREEQQRQQQFRCTVSIWIKHGID